MSLIIPKTVVGGIPENIKDLLRADHVIPAYQRDYVWQEKQVGLLWDDLFDHYDRYAVEEQLVNPEGYFLGAMVLIQDAEDCPPEIVDGQQRVTTLSTIAAVLFDALQTLSPEDKNRVGYESRLRDMLGKFDDERWRTNLKFTDGVLGDFFLNSCLIERDRGQKIVYWNNPWCVDKLKRKRSPIARLKNAIDVGYEKLEAFLAKQPDDDLRKKRLVSFVRLATEAVVVLKIVAKSYSSAYAIFESLNNRSVHLSQADLIKNELLKVAPANDRDDIIDNWSSVRQMVETFKSVQTPDLLHYSYLSRYGRVRARNLYEEAKKNFSSAPGFAKQYSQELADDAAALEAVSETFPAHWTADTINMLKDIQNVLNIKLCFPFLIAAYRKHKNAAPIFEEHVRAVMNFAFRYLKVMEGSLEVFANTVSDAARRVNDGDSIQDVRALFQNQAPDAKFVADFETLSITATKLAYYAVYYLERVQVTGALPVPHGLEQNLEHIMPKTPTASGWPNAYAQYASSREVYREQIWRVGNLIPLPAAINKSIKNRKISDKIKNSTNNDYNSPTLGLVSPKNVAKFLDGEEWSFKSIEDRQKDLARNYAVRAWSL